MNNFSYIYEIKGEANISHINEGPHEKEGILFKLHNSDYSQKYSEIRGIITIKNKNQMAVDIPFIFRKESKLMLIITAFNNHKLTAVNFFNSHIKGKLMPFIPNISREYKLLCESFKTVTASLFKNGEIIDSSDEEIDICETNLQEFELLDAVLYMASKRIVFYYYRNALMFAPNTKDEDMELVFQKFEETMLN
ncbi:MULTISPECIES: hypothetical protein [Methanobacterium]|uniref:Uncharacterized protein n=1 Tax=Methanobacterium veterum TaxID=408577 RepID=A0A9E5A8X5_9EURY|nr:MULTISPECIES: hypothetical protein [Methanobacterium]MCZ3367065.1 hypothetical protein [Methanobacterium veterum]MCZ3373788.1 hypothetical protein [Methanobacterium veterum]